VNAIKGYPQTGALPATIYYIERNLLINAYNIFANGIDWNIQYTDSTDIGDFTLNVAGSNKLRFDQNNGPGTPTVRFLNGYNVDTTFSAMSFTGRVSLNWHLDPLTVNVAMNYVNPYLFRTLNPPFNLPSPGTAAGFQHISASYPIDLHVSYDLPNEGMMSGMQASITFKNLFDQRPPFYNNGLGYDPDNANPMGRLITIGLRKAF
jgi:iron complex outermembrane receptor protein